jgi:hypothetical protein
VLLLAASIGVDAAFVVSGSVAGSVLQRLLLAPIAVSPAAFFWAVTPLFHDRSALARVLMRAGCALAVAAVWSAVALVATVNFHLLIGGHL